MVDNSEFAHISPAERRAYGPSYIDERAPSSGVFIANQLNKAGNTPEALAAFKRAQAAMDSAYGNEYPDPVADAEERRKKSPPTDYPPFDPLARANYPGF